MTNIIYSGWNQWHSLHTWCWLLRFAWWIRWIILTRHATACCSCFWSSGVTVYESLPELGDSLWSSRNRNRLSVVSGEMSVTEYSWKQLNLIISCFTALNLSCSLIMCTKDIRRQVLIYILDQNSMDTPSTLHWH